MSNKQALILFDTIITSLITVAVFLLPLLFLTATTDLATIPKQLLILYVTGLVLIIWGLKVLADRRLILNVNPVNLPLLIFGSILLASSFFSRNRYDSLIQTVPIVAAILFFFVIVNSVKEKKNFSVILSSLILGSAVSAAISVLSFFKIYVLPFSITQSQSFNTLGSSIQQLIYLAPVLVFTLFYLGKKLGFPKFKLSRSLLNNYETFINILASIAIAGGVSVLVYQVLLQANKPVLLPYIYGFQTAAASITQDTQRFILSLLFGSGFGTFATDFTRYKLPAFNLEQNIWNLTFSFSSSFFLELIATAGLLGAASYLWVVLSIIRTRIPGNPIFVAIFVSFALSFILPYSYAPTVLLLILLGLYVAFLNISGNKHVYDSTMSLVSTKSGGFSLETRPEEHHFKNQSPIFPALIFILVLVVVGWLGFFVVRFTVSDIKFAESIKQANKNAQKTYELQSQAIRDFPYKSDYHRIFSQVNLALANSIASGLKGASPSAQAQRNMSILLQQSINSGRNSVILAPLTTGNWQNLSQIYRSLINVGQNADQFAVASINQAIALDPYNALLYIQSGGIYYQLKQWDGAENQFRTAISLKRDFANAYYNLGHVLEQKGDLKGALSSYKAVEQLSKANKSNLDKIAEEIKALEAKIGKASQSSVISPQTDQTPLSISTPSAKFPPQKPPIKISPPPGEEAATPSAQ